MNDGAHTMTFREYGSTIFEDIELIPTAVRVEEQKMLRLVESYSWRCWMINVE